MSLKNLNVLYLQSNEKGDVLNPLITGVFLEVCVFVLQQVDCLHFPRSTSTC